MRPRKEDVRFKVVSVDGVLQNSSAILIANASLAKNGMRGRMGVDDVGGGCLLESRPGRLFSIASLFAVGTANEQGF